MEAIIVASIAAVGGILAALIQQTRKENKQDHGVVASLLTDLHKDVSNVEVKLDRHIESHAVTAATEVVKKAVKKAIAK